MRNRMFGSVKTTDRHTDAEMEPESGTTWIPLFNFVPRALLAGCALVILSSTAQAGPFPSPFNLSHLDGGNGFMVPGLSARDSAGTSVDHVGDVNGDGVDDFAIGNKPGAIYVVFGKTGGFPDSLDLSSLNGTNGFVMNGELGGSVSRAGDVNGDGVNDLVVSGVKSNFSTSYAGAYVVFGKRSGFSASVQLSSLNGNDGFFIRGGYGAFVVSDAGDLNGDGVDDVIVGEERSVRAYVVFGRTGGFPADFTSSDFDGIQGFHITGVSETARISMSAAGDVNGDGFDDVIVGFPFAGFYSPLGQVFIVYGSSGAYPAELQLSSLDGSNGFCIKAGSGYPGYSVSGAGDINGDGVDDLIFGAVGYRGAARNYNTGAAYVLFGRSGGFGASLELSALTASDGFVLRGSKDLQNVGSSVSSAGDVNGDGIDDVIIGASRTTSGNGLFAGAAYVLFGRRGGFGASLDTSSLTGETGFSIYGLEERDETGVSVGGAGDINGDGVSDILVGAPMAGLNGVHSGAAYVLFGRSSTDSDGDGMPDIWETANGLNTLMDDAAADPDRDGLSNYHEYNIGTNPRNPDTDGDTLNDSQDHNPFKPPVRNDFSGDGKSDILWRSRVTGRTSVWFVSDLTITHTAIVQTNYDNKTSSFWQVAATGDFNRSAHADIMWRNIDSGKTDAWLTNGSTVTSSSDLDTTATAFEIVGNGDFDADGTDDLLWHNPSTGGTSIWFFDRGSVSSARAIGNKSSPWSVAVVGDLNADRKADIVWRNPLSGEVTIWLMNGSAVTTATELGVTPISFFIAGSGDFDGNGTDDLIWRNSSTGGTSIWFMNGDAVSSAASLGAVPPDWSVEMTGDHDGDGKSDIVWRHAVTGNTNIWFMTGGTVKMHGNLGNISTVFDIVP